MADGPSPDAAPGGAKAPIDLGALHVLPLNLVKSPFASTPIQKDSLAHDMPARPKGLPESTVTGSFQYPTGVVVVVRLVVEVVGNVVLVGCDVVGVLVPHAS